MKSINVEMAQICASKYVENTYNPLNSSGYFNSYYIRVGEDKTHQPKSVYADILPENMLLLNSDSIASKTFMEKCDYRNEYLIKIMVDKNNNKLIPSVLRSPL